VQNTGSINVNGGAFSTVGSFTVNSPMTISNNGFVSVSSVSGEEPTTRRRRICGERLDMSPPIPGY
jgi:hypothetical protein